jgi:hypothetical protein
MLILRFDPRNGSKQINDIDNMYHGQTAILVGGAPSLREQPIHLLDKPGVLTMAMNNAALHFKPVLWCGCDNPACFAPEILFNPRILKFAPLTQADMPVGNTKYKNMPSTLFFIQEPNVPWFSMLESRLYVPWYMNTLLSSICILYNLGIRRIILAGSDFGGGPSKEAYGHPTELGSLEMKWNTELYNSLVKELRMLKPIFDANNLTLLDCSKYSRLTPVYKHISIEEAVNMCLTDYPSTPTDTKTLPHCSKFAPTHIVDAMARWPGHVAINDDTFITKSIRDLSDKPQAGSAEVLV